MEPDTKCWVASFVADKHGWPRYSSLIVVTSYPKCYSLPAVACPDSLISSDSTFIWGYSKRTVHKIGWNPPAVYPDHSWMASDEAIAVSSCSHTSVVALALLAKGVRHDQLGGTDTHSPTLADGGEINCRANLVLYSSATINDTSTRYVAFQLLLYGREGRGVACILRALPPCVRCELE